MTQWL